MIGCSRMEAALGRWGLCQPLLPCSPSPGPESSSEQLAALERKLRGLEQEKMELSQKLQGMGSQLGQGWVGLTRRLLLQD